MNYISTFVEINWPYLCVYFWTPHYFTLTYKSIWKPTLQYIDYISFVLSSEIMYKSFKSVFFLFQYHLAILVLLTFLLNSGVRLLISKKRRLLRFSFGMHWTYLSMWGKLTPTNSYLPIIIWHTNTVYISTYLSSLSQGCSSIFKAQVLHIFCQIYC